MNHVKLTPEERRSVAEFWRDYLLSGGEGDPPSAFQLDALNDPPLRDAFLFWQAGGDMRAFPEMAEKFSRALEAYDYFGPVPPDPERVMVAQARVMEVLNEQGPEAEDVDTATVLILAYIIWAVLLGMFGDAGRDTAELQLVNLKAAGSAEGILHRDPLIAVGYAISSLAVLARTDPEKARQVAFDCFGIQPGTSTYKFVTEHGASIVTATEGK